MAGKTCRGHLKRDIIKISEIKILGVIMTRRKSKGVEKNKR